MEQIFQNTKPVTQEGAVPCMVGTTALHFRARRSRWARLRVWQQMWKCQKVQRHRWQATVDYRTDGLDAGP